MLSVASPWLPALPSDRGRPLGRGAGYSFQRQRPRSEPAQALLEVVPPTTYSSTATGLMDYQRRDGLGARVRVRERERELGLGNEERRLRAPGFPRIRFARMTGRRPRTCACTCAAPGGAAATASLIRSSPRPRRAVRALLWVLPLAWAGLWSALLTPSWNRSSSPVHSAMPRASTVATGTSRSYSA